MITVTEIMAGLLPILWGHGTGASVMNRIAAPMVGGMISSTVLTLVVIPAVSALWQEHRLRGRTSLRVRGPWIRGRPDRWKPDELWLGHKGPRLA